MHQKALIVRTDASGTHGLDELNVKLGRGWRVASATPLGGGGGAAAAFCLAALVVIERSDELALDVMEQVEEEPEELLEEISEGNGAGLSEEISEEIERDFDEGRP